MIDPLSDEYINCGVKVITNTILYNFQAVSIDIRVLYFYKDILDEAAEHLVFVKNISAENRPKSFKKIFGKITEMISENIWLLKEFDEVSNTMRKKFKVYSNSTPEDGAADVVRFYLRMEAINKILTSSDSQDVIQVSFKKLLNT